MSEHAAIEPVWEEKIEIPDSLPVLPLHHGVLFPELTVPLLISRSEHMQLVDEALVKNSPLVAVAQRDQKVEKHSLADLYDMGVTVFIMKMMRTPQSQYHLLVRTSKKVRLLKAVKEDPFLVARVEVIEEDVRVVR